MLYKTFQFLALGGDKLDILDVLSLLGETISVLEIENSDLCQLSALRSIVCTNTGIFKKVSFLKCKCRLSSARQKTGGDMTSAVRPRRPIRRLPNNQKTLSAHQH